MISRFLFALVSIGLASFGVAAQSTDLTEDERATAHLMLRKIVETVKREYYDANLKGVDLDGLAKKAAAQIDVAKKDILVYSAFADLLDSLGDSHTFFIPPEPEFNYEHGWKMQMVGDRCLVTRVLRDSDAAAKGLRPGDEVIKFNGVPVTRANFSSLSYFFYLLNPLREFEVELKSPSGRRSLNLKAKLVRPGDLPAWAIQPEYRVMNEKLMRARQWANLSLFQFGRDLSIWKLSGFDLAPTELGDIMNMIRKQNAAIIDLRGNSGGYTDSLNRLVGYLFDRPVNMGTRVLRDKNKPEIVGPRGMKSFDGKLVVLVDSLSSSASEHFARIMQIEKRAVVIGDRTAGALQTSRTFDRAVNALGGFRLSITVEGVLLPDGKSLEGVGVTPDEFVIPTPQDLAEGRDPALSRAAKLLGYGLTPERANAIVEEYFSKIEKYLARKEVK